MIHILFYKMTKKTHPNPSIMFDNAFSLEWFKDPLVQRIVRDIDKSDVQGQTVVGPIGMIPIERLSGTAKTLILLRKYEKKYFEPDLVWVGTNGFQLFADIGKERDIYCVLTGSQFNMRGVDDFDFYCVNDNSYCHGRKEWLHKMNMYCTYDDMEVLTQTVKELCDGR